MNSLEYVQPSQRNRSLFIVEGNFEKNVLFRLISKLYPELSIDFDNVWIYETNIYNLYETIKTYYGSDDWDEEDVDLPFILSEKKGMTKCRKEDFTSIILIFDYERQDTYFSIEKIMKMQKYFNDSTDVGKLYINYPMVESLWDLDKVFDDRSFENHSFTADFQKGKEYKNKVRNTPVSKAINLPEKFYDLLKDRFNVSDDSNLKNLINEIFDLPKTTDLQKDVEKSLDKYFDGGSIKQTSYQLSNDINQLDGMQNNVSYWEYLKQVFRFIIYANIKKANLIQNGNYDLSYEECLNIFHDINEEIILDKQNINSKTTDGYIMILNTCLFIIPDYNTNLIK